MSRSSSPSSLLLAQAMSVQLKKCPCAGPRDHVSSVRFGDSHHRAGTEGTGEENAHFQGILRAELRLLRDQLAQMEERIKRLEGQLDMAGCANPSSSLKRFSDYLDMKDNKLKAEIGAIRWVLSKWTLEFERNRDTLRLQQLQVEEEREVDDYLQRIEGFLKAYSARLCG